MRRWPGWTVAHAHDAVHLVLDAFGQTESNRLARRQGPVIDVRVQTTEPVGLGELVRFEAGARLDREVLGVNRPVGEVREEVTRECRQSRMSSIVRSSGMAPNSPALQR